MTLAASRSHQPRRALSLPRALADIRPAAFAFVTLTHDKLFHISKVRGECYPAPGINKLQSSRSRGTPGSWGQARRCRCWELLSYGWGRAQLQGAASTPALGTPTSRPARNKAFAPGAQAGVRAGTWQHGEGPEPQQPTQPPCCTQHPTATVWSSPRSPGTQLYPAPTAQHHPAPRQGRELLPSSTAAAFKCSEPSAAGDDAHSRPRPRPHPHQAPAQHPAAPGGSPSCAPFQPRQCQSHVPSLCQGQRLQTRRGFI